MLSPEKQEAYKAGRIAIREFYDATQANFPKCPYEECEYLEIEWLKGMSDEVDNVEDITVCTYCGSKNIWMCDKVVWCSVNKNDIDDFYYEDNEYPDINTLCENCNYKGQVGNHFCDLSQYIYDLQPNE